MLPDRPFIEIIHQDLLTRAECQIALEVSRLAGGIRVAEDFAPGPTERGAPAPDMVIAGISADPPRLIRALKRELRARPERRAIVLLTLDELGVLPLLVRAGVRGFVLDDHAAADIVPAVRAVASGGAFLTARLLQACAGTPGRERRGQGELALTLREQEVLGLIAAGLSSKAIARRLDLSVRTIETHRLNIRKKTGARDRRDLVRIAGRFGLAVRFGRQDGFPLPESPASPGFHEE
ncbi:MAG: LuxR C-terminal-related transcriptional regulator [Rhabdaerophilum calidifontis]